ncbi:MAG: hypothetical protein ACJ8BW_11025 [Ktedonobacteraceae bacterium]
MRHLKSGADAFLDNELLQCSSEESSGYRFGGIGKDNLAMWELQQRVETDSRNLGFNGGLLDMDTPTLSAGPR